MQQEETNLPADGRRWKLFSDASFTNLSSGHFLLKQVFVAAWLAALSVHPAGPECAGLAQVWGRCSRAVSSLFWLLAEPRQFLIAALLLHPLQGLNVQVWLRKPFQRHMFYSLLASC
jgi:hypothetical protein